MYSNVLNLDDRQLVSETLHCGNGTVYQKRVLQPHGVVTDSIFKDVMLLVAILSWVSKWHQEGPAKDSKPQVYLTHLTKCSG
jgi:hypothetical protein